MIDLKKPLDLKNLDTNDLIGHLLSQKKNIAKLIVVALAGVIVFSLYKNFMNDKRAAESNMITLRQKLEVIDQYKISKNKFDIFVDSLPKYVEEDSLVGTISDFAIRNNIEIVTFSQVSNNAFPFYNLYSLSISVRAKTFKEAVSFMRSIEASGSALRLDSFKINGKDDQGVNLDLNISTIKTKT